MNFKKRFCTKFASGHIARLLFLILLTNFEADAQDFWEQTKGTFGGFIGAILMAIFLPELMTAVFFVLPDNGNSWSEITVD